MRISKKLREGIEWIALNDNDGNGDTIEEIGSYISTLMLADLFGKDADALAIEIAEVRLANGREVSGISESLAASRERVRIGMEELARMKAKRGSR